MMRPVIIILESKKIGNLLKEFQFKHQQIAVIVNEFGGTEGIVTMEDILEEIVVEIHDEYDEVLKEVEHATDGSALVDAKINISDFNEKFKAEIPEDSEYETLNGFLYKQSGKVLNQNDELTFQNLHFRVMKTSQRRIRQVKVRKIIHST
ncbi:MAG: CBS domain-containing protein [Ignavibacteriales bacterium]|nr:CBS domain-containing protein [Ignavibacteriales bacterium]